MHVEQIGATLDIRPFGARERFLDFGGVADHLALHAVAAGRLGEIDVRAAIVAGVILACFELLSSDKAPDAVVTGLANATEFSGYEPLARNFYTQQVQVPLQCHAVDRSRYVVSSAFDWSLIGRTEGAVFYTEQASLPLNSQQVRFQNPYVLFFHFIYKYLNFIYNLKNIQFI